MDWISRDFSRDRTILDGLKEHSGSGHTAVICGKDSVTFTELIGKAKRIASGLVSEGVKKGDYVILDMDRSVEFICALLGILYAGAAYVAIDREWPRERLDYIRENAKAAASLDEDMFRRLCEMESEADLPDLDGSDAFAVYYTSGSTGKPKGTVTHHALFLHEAMPVPGNICAYETARSCGVVFSMGNFAYGATACDIIYSLYNALTLVFATDQERLSPALLGECMKRHRADALLATPSALLMHLEDPVFAEGFALLKRVILTGEALSLTDSIKIANRTTAVLFDAFGASEVRNYSFTRVIPGKPVELGSATEGALLLVLDEEGKPCAEGELCIGGIPGRYGYYIGLPELTKEKFTESAEFGRIYHTGDGARVMPNGSVRLTGRRDGMRKFHGQRLEAGEIESVMKGFEGVAQAAVDIRGEGPEAVLCAWYKAAQEIDEGKLRAFLADALPAYMVPTLFQRLDELPLNTNGKLDRRALPDIRTAETLYRAPDTELLRQICEAFEHVLKTDGVGADDNFFLLGGDSIRAMQLVSYLMDKYDLRFTVRELVAYPTPSSLSSLKEEAGRAGSAKLEEVHPSRKARTLPDKLRTIAADAEAVLPCSGPTVAFLYMKRSGVKDRFNVNRFQIRVRGAWDEGMFRGRIEALVRNHPALRSSFQWDGTRYWQIIHKSVSTPLWHKSISHLALDAAERFTNGFWQVMDGEDCLFAAACFVLSNQESLLLLKADHTVCDGLSVYVMANELTADDYLSFAEDGYIAHRERAIASADNIAPQIRDYYANVKPLYLSPEPLKRNQNGIRMDEVELDRREKDYFIRECAKSGILPYSMALYAFGQAILRMENTSEVWMRILDAGRYMEWGDEFRIIGNLICGFPVRVSADMTPRQFQNDLLRLRDSHGIMDSDLLSDRKWAKITEGLVFNNFLELNAPVEELQILGDDKRRGNTLIITDEGLSVRLRHADMDVVNTWYQELARVFRNMLLDLPAGDVTRDE